MDRDEAVKVATMVSAAFPSWKPTRETVQLYADILQPLPERAVKRAVMALLREPREFAPPVGVIFQRAVQIAMAEVGIPILTAEEAGRWLQGPNWYAGGPGPGAPPAVVNACHTVGWDRICHDPNVAATFAHFTRVFNVLQKREVQQAVETLVEGGKLGWRESATLLNGMPLEGDDEAND